MIEVIAKGPVEVKQSERVKRSDGRDMIRGRVTMTHESVALIDLELESGHVNLEAFAPSATADRRIGDTFFWYIDELERQNGTTIEVVEKGWDVRLQGEWWDWIQAAARYQIERADMSLTGVLRLFKGWDETNDRQIKRAISELSDIQAAEEKPVLMDIEEEQAYISAVGELNEHIMLERVIPSLQ